MKLEMKNDVLILEAVIPCSYIKSSIFGVGGGGGERRGDERFGCLGIGLWAEKPMHF